MTINRIIVFSIFYISFIFSIDTDGDVYSDQLELDIGTDPKSKEDR